MCFLERIEEVLRTNEKAIEFLREKKVITKITTTMWNLRQPNDASEEKRYTRWLCLEVSKAHRKKEINKAGSFIEKSKLTLRQFVSMIYARSLKRSLFGYVSVLYQKMYKK